MGKIGEITGDTVGEDIIDQIFSQMEPFVNSVRQAEILRQADLHLAEALTTVNNGMSVDFISIDLRSSWEKLGEITGDTVGEDIIDQIFSQFCIGK